MDFEFDDLFNDETKEKTQNETDDLKNELYRSDSDDDKDEDKLPWHKKSFEDFKSLKTIGEGAYGKVYQVQDYQTRKIYAMKVLKKAHLLKKKAISCTITEKDILRKN